MTHRRRAPFLLHGNVQLVWLLGLSAMAAVGMLVAAVLNVRALEPLVDRAAFVAHLSLTSSAAVVWRAILEVNLWAAGVIVLAGCITMASAVWYLERFFRAIAEGAARLVRGERSWRLPVGGARWGSALLREFNDAAASMQRREERARALLQSLSSLVVSDQRDWLTETKTLQQALRDLYGV